MTGGRLNFKTLISLFSVLLLTLAVWAEPVGSKGQLKKEPVVSNATAGPYSGYTADVNSPAKADQIRKNDLLQFTAGGHVVGFKPGEMYLAAADHALKVEFVGARSVAPVAQTESSSASENRQAAKPLGAVTYPDLWDGISLVYEKGAGGLVKSTYHVAKGTRPSKVDQIRLAYNVPVRLDDSGGLLLTFKTGQLRESAPIAWQEIEGERIPVDVAFRVLGEKEVGFSVEAFDPAFPLVIDPEFSWNTFMGSTSMDEGFAIAVDGSGNVYVAGKSNATWGTPVNPHAGGGYSDAFVAKFDSSGTLLWNTFSGTYEGGSVAIAVDATGNVYVAGSITGEGNGGFAVKFDSSGVVQWNTYLGYKNYARAIAVDPAGNVYVAGTSDRNWGSPVNPYAGGRGQDAYAAQLNSSGELQWNTFMGSTNWDSGEAIVVDSSGVYVAGTSDGSWGTPVNPYAGGGMDSFAAKLDSSGVRQWHTFMGSTSMDEGFAIAVDGSGNVFVGGYSEDTWGTPVNAHTGYFDAFAAKLDSSGVRQWNTFMGSTGYDGGSGIAVDGSGNVFVGGYSAATWGTPDNPHAGNDDAFAAQLNSSGALQWNTFMGSGTAAGDYSYGIAVDGSGVYVAGYSGSTWGTPLNAHAGGGADDAFVAKLALSSERTALIDLYNSTNGDSWTNNSNWKSITPLEPDGFSQAGTECSWFGITCDGSDNVTEISLASNNLVGAIPASIANLTNLQNLYLYGNQLTGSIPPELGNLSNLTTLNIDRNQLTGSIPPELGNLTNLQSLSLTYNQLSGSIPPELGDLSNLRYLYLNDNSQLSGSIPPELGNLSNLYYLRLRSNQLTGSIPPELGDLSNLRDLSLQGNQLTGSIPTELGNLANLQYLILAINQLTGSIPTELGNLANLLHLTLYGNQLTGSIPTELGNLSNLERLWLSNTQLTGSIPTELGNLSNLLILYLYGNQLTGSIPTELGSLSNLTHLYLYDNQLTGSIPPELGDLSNLRYLYLFSNQLSGSIPTELGNLSSLTSMQVENNQLSGSIPPELGDLSILQYLRLNSNQLMGPVPFELTNLTSLLDNQSDFRTNALYTYDNTLRTFLNSKQIGGNWESSQSSPAPDITVTDTVAPNDDLQIPFGNVTEGNSSDQTVTVTNDGNANLVIGTIAQADPLAAPFSILNDTCSGQTLASAASCTFDVRFAPAATGVFNDSLDIPSNDSDEDPVTINVDGTGIQPAQNNPPLKPEPVSPANEAVVAPGDVTLQSSAYVDPEGDGHVRSHWRLSRVDRMVPPYIEDITSSTDLTQHTVLETQLEEGLKYLWQVGYEDDGSGNTSWSDAGTFKVGVSTTDSLQVYAGTQTADFVMISFTMWPDSPASNSVFDINYNTLYHRIGTYDPAEGGTGGYVEFGSSLLIEPGRAYWSLARNGLNFNYSGVPVSLAADIDVRLNYNTSSNNGWNMVGSPNAANYYWQEVEVMAYDSSGTVVFEPTPLSAVVDPNPYIDVRIWRWNSGAYESYMPGDSFLMQKYDGYWVQAKQDNVYLRFPVSAQIASLSKSDTMLASLWSNGKRWMKTWVFTPKVALADSNDSPPPPIGDFSSNSQDGGGSGGGGDCFIATAAYGHSMAPHVKILREFRDGFLLNNSMGKAFVQLYYTYSPPVADFIAKHANLRAITRLSLLPVVGLSWVALKVGPVHSLALMLFVCSVLIGIVGFRQKFKK